MDTSSIARRVLKAIARSRPSAKRVNAVAFTDPTCRPRWSVLTALSLGPRCCRGLPVPATVMCWDSQCVSSRPVPCGGNSTCDAWSTARRSETTGSRPCDRMRKFGVQAGAPRVRCIFTGLTARTWHALLEQSRAVAQQLARISGAAHISRTYLPLGAASRSGRCCRVTADPKPSARALQFHCA